jgi:hypothetical protein
VLLLNEYNHISLDKFLNCELKPKKDVNGRIFEYGNGASIRNECGKEGGLVQVGLGRSYGTYSQSSVFRSVSIE